MKKSTQMYLCMIGLWCAGFTIGLGVGDSSATKRMEKQMRTSQQIGYQQGFHSGIGMTLKHIKIKVDTNSPGGLAVDLADVLAERDAVTKPTP